MSGHSPMPGDRIRISKEVVFSHRYGDVEDFETEAGEMFDTDSWRIELVDPGPISRAIGAYKLHQPKDGFSDSRWHCGCGYVTPPLGPQNANFHAHIVEAILEAGR